MWSVPCLAHMTRECRDCPGSGHVGAGVSRECLPWTAGGWKRWHAHPTKRKVETNDRDGPPHRITVRPWIGTHPTSQGSRPVLTGEIAVRCCIDSPCGCFNVLSAHCARLAIHVSLPTRGDARNLFFFCLSFVFCSPFSISHDRTHLGADCFSRPLPFRTI